MQCEAGPALSSGQIGSHESAGGNLRLRATVRVSTIQVCTAVYNRPRITSVHLTIGQHIASRRDSVRTIRGEQVSINISTNSIVEVRLEYLLGTDVAYNVLHYRATNLEDPVSGLPPAVEVPFSAVADIAAQAFYDYFDDLWKAAAVVSAKFTGVTVQNVFPSPRSRQFTYNPPDIISGLVAGEALPLQDTLTILKKTQYGERWGLGRVFFVGLAEAQQAGGNIVPEVRDDLQAYAHLFDDAIIVTGPSLAVTMQPVLFANIPDPETGDPTTEWRTTPITNSNIDSWVLKTQRRRRPGKGI